MGTLSGEHNMTFKLNYFMKNIGLITGILLLMTFNIPNNIFSDMIYNWDVTVNNWDVMHLLLGFYSSSVDATHTYLDLTNTQQLFLPVIFQVLGIIATIRFLRYPLSFHLFIKQRASSKWDYFLFFFKKMMLDAVIYTISLIISLSVILYTSPILSTESSFNYQEGNFKLHLFTYAVLFFIMLIVASVFIFIGYIQNQALLFLLITVSILTTLNVLDRVVTAVNLILFDGQFFFIDSFFFWLVLLMIEVMYLSRRKIRQESYND